MTKQSIHRRASVRLAYVKHMKSHTRAPTIRELSALTGISSTSLVKHYQEVLERDGWLVRVGDEGQWCSYMPAGARDALIEWARVEQKKQVVQA